MTPLKEQIIKEFEEKYGYEEIYICADCRHSKESHYWNGGGRSENSGYDKCRVNNCECLSENWIIEKIKTDVSCYTDFISQALDRQLEEIRKKLPEDGKVSGYVGDYGEGFDNGFNDCLSKIKEILK